MDLRCLAGTAPGASTGDPRLVNGINPRWAKRARTRTAGKSSSSTQATPPTASTTTGSTQLCCVKTSSTATDSTAVPR